MQNDAPTISYVQESDNFIKRNLVNLIEVATGRNQLTDIYRILREDPFEIALFLARGIELGRLDLDYNRHAETQIPKEGPLVFIANHPFGIVDGLILCELAARTRGDFRILLNNRLMEDDNLNQFFLPVDFDGTREATKRNVDTKKEAQRLLQEGGTLIIFPAGGVATRWQFGMGPLEDLPWTTFTAKIVRKSRATVVPLNFQGENSFLFHFASSLGESPRLSLFIREVTRQIGTTIRFTIGDPISYEDMEHIESRKELTRFLKDKVESMAVEPSKPRLPIFSKPAQYSAR